MGTQQKKKKRTPDTRSIISEVKREQDKDAINLAVQPTHELGFSPTGINTIDFVNVTTTLVSGTQTMDAGLPGAPQNLTGAPASSTQINVAWNHALSNPAATNYKIYRGNDPLFTTGVSTTISASLTSTAFTLLTTKTRYWFKASTINANGEGATGEVITTMTL